MTAFAQGEVYARTIEELPAGLSPFTERAASGAWIVSHSETGHHHLIDAPGVEVLERTTDVPEGMRILYAIVKEPTRMWQDAADAHEAHDAALDHSNSLKLFEQFEQFEQFHLRSHEESHERSVLDCCMLFAQTRLCRKTFKCLSTFHVNICEHWIL
jgi:hypothetical protein